MDNFLKQMAQLRSDFRDVQQKIDVKVDHMLKMLASMQLQLQMQEMTKGEEIGDDFNFAEPQLHNLPYLPLRRPQKIEGESEILPPNEHRSLSSYDSCAAQLEREGFVGVLNHTPITTTMAKSRFGEPKSEVLADLKLNKPNSVFEILPKQPLVVYLCSAVIESSKNSDAWKVFDELTRRELNSLEAIVVVVDVGNVIYIYKKENNVKNEATIANLVVGCDIDETESMMGFDPGGDPKVFDKCSYKKLLYFEELILFRSCPNSPRNNSKSYNPRWFMEEVTSGFNVTDLHRSWLQVKATQSPPKRNTRLENTCRRIWNLAWQKKQLGAEESQRKNKWHLDRERGWREAVTNMSDLYEGEKGDLLGEITSHSENNRGQLPKINSVETTKAWTNQKVGDKLYIVLTSLHGWIHGESMELCRDSNIGGHVKCVVELASALGSIHGVYGVDLLISQVSSLEVDWIYGEPTKMLPPSNFEGLVDEIGENCSAYIVRFFLVPKDKGLPKELLWSHIHESVDGALNHIIQMSKVPGEQIGNGHPVWLVAIHGRYAAVGDFASFFSGALNVPMFFTSPSLDHDKLEQLLRQGQQLRDEINSSYKVMQKIGAKELFPDASKVFITSTKHEIEESDGRSSNFQQNDRRHRYQNLVHGISIQVLEELSFVIRSTCETTSQLLEDNIFDNLPSYKWWKDGSVSWTILLKEYIIYENRDIMKSLLEGMLDTLRYTNIFNVMIDGYVKLGDMRLAQWLFNMMHDWNLFSGNIMLVEYFWNKQPHEVIELLEQVSVLKMVEMNGVPVIVVVPTLADLYSFVKKKILDKYLEVLLLIDVGVVMTDIEENYQTYKADKTFDGMVDVIFSNVAQLDQRLQVEHFKLTELVAWELQQDHACGWTKKLDQPLPKPPPQFRYLSREDTTHSRRKYCYVNGRVRCGDLGEVELLPKMKLGVGKPLDWAVLIGLLSLFYFMFSAHCLGPYGGYSTLVYLT